MVTRLKVMTLVLFMGTAFLVACGSKGSPPPPTATGIPSSPSPTVVVTQVANPTSQPTSAPSSSRPKGVVAVVNGHPISETLFTRQMAQVQAFLEQQGMDLSTEEGKRSLEQAKRQVLEQVIDQELVREAAGELGVSITDAKLDATMQKGIEQGGGREKLNAWLKENKMTFDDYRELVRNDLLANAVRQKVVPKIPEKVPQVHARHILVNTKEEAEAILAKLKKGADFAKLAKEKSLDVGSRDKGGDLGFFPAGVMTPAFEKAAFALKANEISGVVQTPFGFHIIQVIEVDQARKLSNDMRQRLENQSFRHWLQKRREQATIERYLP